MKTSWDEFLSTCQELGMKVEKLNGTIWDEAGGEHAPASQIQDSTGIEIGSMANINGIVVVLENPDDHMWCLWVIGDNPDADKIRQIWDNI